MWSIERYNGSVIDYSRINQPLLINARAPNYKEIEFAESDSIIAMEVWIRKSIQFCKDLKNR